MADLTDLHGFASEMLADTWASYAEELLEAGTHPVDEDLPREVLDDAASSAARIVPVKPNVDPATFALTTSTTRPHPGLPLLAPALQQSQEWLVHREAGASEDPVVEKVCNFFMNEGKKLHLSKKALGVLLTVDPVKLEPALNLLASILVQLDKGQRAVLEQKLAASGAELLCYYDFHKYDDTPLKVNVQHTLAMARTTALGPSPAAETPGGHSAASTSAQVPLFKVSTKCKVLACENHCQGSTGEPSSSSRDGRAAVDDFEGLVFDLVAGLAKFFCPHHESSVARLSLCGARDRKLCPEGESCHLRLCRLQLCSRACHERCLLRVLGLHPSTLSGASHSTHALLDVLNAAESHLRTRECEFVFVVWSTIHHHRFKECLISAAQKRLTLIRGEPPLQARVYRDWVLKQFCSIGPSKQVKRLTLLSLKRRLEEHRASAGLHPCRAGC